MFLKKFVGCLEGLRYVWNLLKLEAYVTLRKAKNVLNKFCWLPEGLTLRNRKCWNRQESFWKLAKYHRWISMKYLAKKFQYYRQSKLVPWDAQNAWGSWMPEGLGANTKKNRKLPGTWQNSFWTTIGKIGLKLKIGGFWTRTIFCNYTKKCWNVTFENCPKWPKWIENCSGVDPEGPDTKKNRK